MSIVKKLLDKMSAIHDKADKRKEENPMLAQIIGYMTVDFDNKEGQHIKGKNIFAAFPDENCVGLRAEKFFLKDGIELPKDFKVNDKVDISFTHKGKIEAIHKAN